MRSCLTLCLNVNARNLSALNRVGFPLLWVYDRFDLCALVFSRYCVFCSICASLVCSCCYLVFWIFRCHEVQFEQPLQPWNLSNCMLFSSVTWFRWANLVWTQFLFYSAHFDIEMLFALSSNIFIFSNIWRVCTRMLICNNCHFRSVRCARKFRSIRRNLHIFLLMLIFIFV